MSWDFQVVRYLKLLCYFGAAIDWLVVLLKVARDFILLSEQKGHFYSAAILEATRGFTNSAFVVYYSYNIHITSSG